MYFVVFSVKLTALVFCQLAVVYVFIVVVVVVVIVYFDVHVDELGV